jgi:hypothetical protein
VLFSVIKKLCALDFDNTTIARIVEAFPNGVGSKFVRRTDLPAELARVRAKTAPGRKARGGARQIRWRLGRRYPSRTGPYLEDRRYRRRRN